MTFAEQGHLCKYLRNADVHNTVESSSLSCDNAALQASDAPGSAGE